MRSASWIAIATVGAAAGCADPIGLGEASSTAHPTAASATTTIANVDLIDPLGTYRVWSIEIGEAAPGTDCHNRGDALITYEIWTIFNSAPRGEILLSMDPPPIIFPSVYAAYANGTPIEGVMTIDAAASSGLFGSFSGAVNVDGTRVDIVVTFEAPTCGV